MTTVEFRVAYLEENLLRQTQGIDFSILRNYLLKLR